MTGDEQRDTPRYRESVHHGRTGAAWTGIAVATVGFVLCAIAVLTGPNWTLFWISIGVLALALVATRVMQVLGFGQLERRAPARSAS